jgi:hypothetical protein
VTRRISSRSWRWLLGFTLVFSMVGTWSTTSADATGPVPTTTKLSASANPAPAGSTVRLTATVGPLDLLVTPSGTVTFTEVDEVLGTVPLRGGCIVVISPCAATLTLPSLPAGTHHITAQYNGDAFSAPSSASIDEVLDFTPGDFTVLPSQSLTAPAGGSGTATISTWSTSDASTQRGTINLSVAGVPPGATATFTPAAVTAGDDSMLTVDAGTAANGTYTLTVTGSDGTISHSAQVPLTITAPQPDDFTISISPTHLILGPGGSATTTVSTGVLTGNPGPIDLAISGVPPGATASLNTDSVAPGESALLTIDMGSAAPGEYPITVTGTEVPVTASGVRSADVAEPSHAATTQATSGTNLIDHGGKVLSASHTYGIWWGDQTKFPADAKAGIKGLLSGLHGTPFLSLATQYMRGAALTSTFVASANDASSPPTGSPATSTIVAEACRAINANAWTTDPQGIYFVFTSNFPRNVSFCAWHSHGTCNGKDIQVGYMPNTTGLAGCDPGNQFNCNTLSQGTRSLANVLSHEFMEAVSDPDLNAWFDSSGSEMGDKAAWVFGSCVNLANGTWQLQEEWSNAAHGSVQQ